MSRAFASSFEGFLPEPAFVMAKKQAVEKSAAKDIARGEAPSAPLATLSLEGREDSALIFIIEKDEAGPYEGRAGQLLQKMIAAMGVRHTDVLMISIDASPGSSSAAKAEFQTLLQGRASRAKVGIALGEVAAAFVQQTPAARSQNENPSALSWIVSFHPSRLLAEPALKKEAWEHLKLAAKTLGWTLPPRGV